MYKGETDSKAVSRELVWRQHELLLGVAVFRTVPHAFLASQFAGDIGTLRDMCVLPPNIWAVESDRNVCHLLYGRHEKEGFKLFPQAVETLMEGKYGAAIRSVYLDYCGHIEGMEDSIRRVVSKLPAKSVVSITLFLGREKRLTEDRETALLKLVRANTKHNTTLVQSILYSSSREDITGSSMTTWTFYIGSLSARPPVRFDLKARSKAFLTVPGLVDKLWSNRLTTLIPMTPTPARCNVESRRSQTMATATKTTKKSAKQLTNIALRAVQTRRDKNPGGSTEPLTTAAVQAAFKRRKAFSTGDIMREFGAAKDNATACAAILRGRKLIEKVGEAGDGTSVWRWTA